MGKTSTSCSRRRFLKITGAAGMGALLPPLSASAQSQAPQRIAKQANMKVPTRPFGQSGRQVSILSLGGMFDIAANQRMLRQAFNWGVTYWDTADCYQRGSETGIGKFFKKSPELRPEVFLVSKSDARDPFGIGELLDRSLERMHTDYIDLYFIHGISDIDELDDRTRLWAEKAKKEGKIKLFGFSTHSNMEACLLAASQLDWIDGIMMTYNYRNMHSPTMKAAVDACTKAGIGLTAMKTMASSSWFSFGKENHLGNQLAERFTQKGFTEEQAKLKAVWTNPQIASICSQMPNYTILQANVAAAVDRTELADEDLQFLQTYAKQTSSHYCAGCAHICEAAVDGAAPIGDIMRYHMYSRSYGQADWARRHFQKLPHSTRRRLASIDFSAAQARCPHRMPIAQLMREALEDYA